MRKRDGKIKKMQLLLEAYARKESFFMTSRCVNRERAVKSKKMVGEEVKALNKCNLKEKLKLTEKMLKDMTGKMLFFQLKAMEYEHRFLESQNLCKCLSLVPLAASDK